MELTIRSTDFRLYESLSELVKEKFNRLPKFYNRIRYCTVTISKEKSEDQKDCVVEAKITMPRKIVYAKQKADTFETAIEMILDALKDQIIHFKEQLQEA